MDEGWSNKGSIPIGLSRLVGGYVDTEILMDTEARYDELLKVADDNFPEQPLPQGDGDAQPISEVLRENSSSKHWRRDQFVDSPKLPRQDNQGSILRLQLFPDRVGRRIHQTAFWQR